MKGQPTFVLLPHEECPREAEETTLPLSNLRTSLGRDCAEKRSFTIYSKLSVDEEAHTRLRKGRYNKGSTRYRNIDRLSFVMYMKEISQEQTEIL